MSNSGYLPNKQPARVFITGGEELISVEGATQGNPLSISLYALSLQPLITRLHVSSAAKQCWFADDATGSGSLKDLRKWWDKLSESGPPLVYFPNAKKCWLIIKPEREEAAREVFRDTAFNVTIESHKHLGAALGSRLLLEEYVEEKVDEWVNEVTKLADFYISQPQASYVAFIFGLRHRWTYFLRTLRDIAEFLKPLDCTINEVLIPAVTDHTVTNVDHGLLGFPVLMGGLGFTNSVVTSFSEYEASIKVTNPLVRRIVEQKHQPSDASEIRTLQLSTQKQDDCLSERPEQVKNSLPIDSRRAVELATEKGSLNWLTVIPVKELDYNLNKKEFRDAIKLRYDWEITDTPMICACGLQFSVDHEMVCHRDGFIISRDLEAEMLRIVFNDVEVEPVLQEVTGETLKGHSQLWDRADLDTTFASLKSVYLNQKSNLRVGYI